MFYMDFLAEDRELITYRKSLRPIAGSVTSTILLQQIIFRFVNHDRKPFYKFKEPCGNEFYRAKDSWTEELGFSAEEFDLALKYISTKIKITDDKEITPDQNADMKTKAKCIVTCWMDVHRRTWYHVNEALLNDLITLVYVNRQTRYSLENVEPKPVSPVQANRQTRYSPTGDPGLPLYITETTPETTAETNNNTSRAQFGDKTSSSSRVRNEKGKFVRKYMSDKKPLVENQPMAIELPKNEPPKNDDDDEAMRLFAIEILKDMPNWNGGIEIVKEEFKESKKLYALVTWLWLYAILHNPSLYENGELGMLEKRVTYPDGQFKNVKSIPGKIITQVRRGNHAPLLEIDLAQMKMSIENFKESS